MTLGDILIFARKVKVMKKILLIFVACACMISCDKDEAKPEESKNISSFEEYVEYTIKSGSEEDEGSLWVQNPSLNLDDPRKSGIVDTLLFKNGVCYKHSTLDGWAYSIENGKITFTKDGESKTFNYSSKGKDVMVIGGFEGVSVTYCTKEVQYVKVKESPKTEENDGSVIFYTNAHLVINTPAFMVTTVFVDSTFVGALTTSDYFEFHFQPGVAYDEQTIEPPADDYETDASVLNIPMSEGEHSFYAFFGISPTSRMGVKGTFTITKGECTKIFLDAYKSTYDL